MRSFRRTGAAIVAGAALVLSVPAYAQTGSTAPGAAADAYALDIDVTLPLGIAVDEGPFARATQEFPPQAAEPAEDEVLSTGQIPSGGAVVENIGVLQSIAGATGQPLASASAQAVNVELINQGGVPLITADLIRAQSTTDCTNAPSAAGTDFVNLRVAGVTDPIPTPDPNTALLPEIFDPLGIRVMLNEQHPTADGRGLVVNAIHIYNMTDIVVPPIFVGDIVVSHAMSTVNCPNGAPSTGDDNDLVIVKNADKPTVRRGELVTYTATFQNKSELACVVNTVIDHLPVAFEHFSTSGAFGSVAETVARPGGGTDVVIKPEGVTIAPGASASQTFVVKVKDDAAPATYFNNVEIFCANLGNWVKGLDAPVRVVIDQPRPTPSPTPDVEDEEPLPRTGLPAVLAGLGAAVAAGALILRRVLNSRP